MAVVLSKAKVPIAQGDYVTLVFTSTQKTGDVTTPLDLTGAVAEFQVARDYKRAPPAFVWRSDDADPKITITDAANGESKLIMEPEDTEAFGPRRFMVWTLTMHFIDGKPKRVAEGVFDIHPSVV